MAVFLAFLSAVAFGGADFIGGLASRRASAVSVVVTAHIIGLSVILVVAPFWGSESAALSDFLWGAAAGTAGAVGLTVLYHALATTRFTVAAPAAALLGATVPVIFGLMIGERPGGAAWIGIALSVPWPLVGARMASIPTMAVVAMAMGKPLLVSGNTIRIAVTAGAADMVANILLLAALHEPGLISLVLLISSLYPAFTVILARIVLEERMTRTQVGGLLMAGVGIALISIA